MFPPTVPSSPPSSYFDHDLWAAHHEALNLFFGLGDDFHALTQVDTLVVDKTGKVLCHYFPDKLLQFTNIQKLSEALFTFTKTKSKKSEPSRRFRNGATEATHHGFHCYRRQTWKFFATTNEYLLQCLKPLLCYVEFIYQTQHFSIWCNVRRKLPIACGLFYTVWTTVVVNQDYSEWHFDPQDCGLTAIVYIGEFIGGELLLGKPCDLKILVGNMDLIFFHI